MEGEKGERKEKKAFSQNSWVDGLNGIEEHSMLLVRGFYMTVTKMTLSYLGRGRPSLVEALRVNIFVPVFCDY